MQFSWQALFFIALLLFSSFFVNGLIIPSFAVPPIPTTCDSCHPIAASEWSPLKQFKFGIPLPNIFCKSGLVLVFKISESTPTCVKPDTAQKLVERGWGVLNEQTAWFEYTGIECQQTPWDKYGSTFASMFTKTGLIKQYFKVEQGITIFESMWTYYLNAHQPPACGQPADSSYYFLVSQSYIDKMSNLGYKKVDNIPSWAHSVDKS